MPPKKEGKPAELSLYCKQSTIENAGQDPWACGPSAAVTAMRLAGNRDIQADELPALLRSWGDQPTEGLYKNQLIDLLRGFGHTVSSFSEKKAEEYDLFKAFLKDAWSRCRPTVVAWRSGPTYHDHYVVAYSNPGDAGVWVMDPHEDRWVFSDLSWDRFLSCTADKSGEYCSYEAVSVGPRNEKDHVIPPSSSLIEWINWEVPGDVEAKDFVAAAFCENFYDTAAEHAARNGDGLLLGDILASGGELWEKIEVWDNYYDGRDVKDLQRMRHVAEDLARWKGLRVRPERVPLLCADLALVFVHTLMYWRWLEEQE